MSTIFYAARFRRSDKEKENETCFISNHKVKSTRTSDGGEVILDEVFILSSFPKGGYVEGRVDEEGFWDVECVESRKKPGVFLVKKARRGFDRIVVELNGGYVNIVVNNKLAVYTDEDGNIHKLGYNGVGITEYRILGMFYKLVPSLNLSPDFSVIEFEKEFLRQVDVSRTMSPLRKFAEQTVATKKKRPRIKRV